MNTEEHRTVITAIEQAEKIFLFPHIMVDGDALGSSVAFCKALRKMGKEAYILMEDAMPVNLAFLDQGYCTWQVDRFTQADLVITIDCSDMERFPKRQEVFKCAKQTLNIDHHKTNTNFADINVIDPVADSTGILIYDLLKLLQAPIDTEIAEALYVSVSTDTGNFQYSNTTKHGHLIVADLHDYEIDVNKISIHLYQNSRLEKIRVTAKIIDLMELHFDGKCAIAWVTQELLEAYKARMEETEGVVEVLRSIQGVEVAVFFKELEPEVIKISMRSKLYVDVSQIAEVFQGGGHVRAAGCSIRTNLEHAKQIMLQEIEKYI